jgi:hypothetical protein
MDNEFSADEKITFAYLNEDGKPVLRSSSEWRQWWKREGDRCQVKYDRIDNWEIETGFQAARVALDGLPLFRDVTFLVPSSLMGFGDSEPKEAALDFHAEVIGKDNARRISPPDLP